MDYSCDKLLLQLLKQPLQDGMTPARQLLQQIAQEARDEKGGDDANSCEDHDM